MKKSLKKVIVIIMVLLLSITILNSYNVFAATPITIASTDTPHSLTITRNIKNVTNNVTNTFGYTVTAASTNPTGATDEPTAFTIEYNNVIPNASNIASKTGTLDFTGATYTKVGDYKYTVQETSSAVDENGVQTGALVATLVSQVINTADREAGKQDMTYPNESTFTNITVTNNVTGNMADEGEYFKFLLTIDGTTGDTYTITGQDTSITYGGSTVTPSTTYTVGATPQYIYLKHGQTATIGKNGELNQIKVGTTYQLIEQDAATYKTYINGSTTDSKDSGNLTTVKTATSNTIAVVNNKEAITLTGIFLDMAPYIAIIIVLAAVMFIFVKSKRKNEEE